MLNLFVMLRLIPRGFSLFYISYGYCTLLGSEACYIGISSLLALINSGLYALCFSFLYRYAVLIRSVHGQRSTLVLICLALTLPCVFQAATFSTANDNEDTIRSLLGNDLGYNIYNLTVSGHITIFRFWILYTIAGTALMTLLTFIIAFWCRKRVLAALSIMDMSPKTKRMHHDLMMALTSMPVIKVKANQPKEDSIADEGKSVSSEASIIKSPTDEKSRKNGHIIFAWSCLVEVITFALFVDFSCRYPAENFFCWQLSLLFLAWSLIAFYTMNFFAWKSYFKVGNHWWIRAKRLWLLLSPFPTTAYAIALFACYGFGESAYKRRPGICFDPYMLMLATTSVIFLAPFQLYCTNKVEDTIIYVKVRDPTQESGYTMIAMSSVQNFFQ
ncbi:unnamed protein product, partial [Mesorhabditis belari]|uniref:Uncharacterized protein n=1 Tax=Mesorhabditis belari TaxID=2138241 RepID=A0AAF3ES50_9BILA